MIHCTSFEQSKIMRGLTHQERLKKWDWHGIEWDWILANKGHSNYTHVFVVFSSFISGLMCMCIIWSLWYSGELFPSSFSKWRNRGSETLSDFLKNKWQVRSGEAVTIGGMVGGRTSEKLLFHKKSRNTGNNCQRQLLENSGKGPKGSIYS